MFHFRSAPCHVQIQCYVSRAECSIHGRCCMEAVVLMASCGGVQSYVVTGSFRGWKMVPAGPHYLTYNAASRSGDFAPAVAVLCHLAGRQVLVRRWAPALELLLPLDDEEEVPFPTHSNGLITDHRARRGLAECITQLCPILHSDWRSYGQCWVTVGWTHDSPTNADDAVMLPVCMPCALLQLPMP